MQDKELFSLISASAEVMGQKLSPEAIVLIIEDLSSYTVLQIRQALKKIRTNNIKLTSGNIILNIEDGRPGVEEAWSLLPKDEQSSSTWTAEMREAYSRIHDLIIGGDLVAARMAFKEVYSELLKTAREDKAPVKWEVSLGYDKSQRDKAIKKAYELNRIGESHVRACLPPAEAEEVVDKIAIKGKPQITASSLEGQSFHLPEKIDDIIKKSSF